MRGYAAAAMKVTLAVVALTVALASPSFAATTVTDPIAVSPQSNTAP
jgi:hypothetical protein